MNYSPMGVSAIVGLRSYVVLYKSGYYCGVLMKKACRSRL